MRDARHLTLRASDDYWQTICRQYGHCPPWPGRDDGISLRPRMDDALVCNKIKLIDNPNAMHLIEPDQSARSSLPQSVPIGRPGQTAIRGFGTTSSFGTGRAGIGLRAQACGS